MGKCEAVMLLPLQNGTAGLMAPMHPFIHFTTLFFTVRFRGMLKPTTSL